jgi:hypothetical protein
MNGQCCFRLLDADNAVGRIYVLDDSYLCFPKVNVVAVINTGFLGRK